jgi:hypothetical protein
MMTDMKDYDDMSPEEFDTRLDAGDSVDVFVDFARASTPLWTINVGHGGLAREVQRAAYVSVEPREPAYAGS